MELLDFYKGMLAAAGVNVDENGYAINTVAGVNQAVTISGKRLVLPTKEVLAGGMWDKVVAFHPASESVIRGESPVLRKLRTGFQNRINFIVMSMLEASFILAANTELHAKFSPTQNTLLRVLSGVEGEKSIKAARAVTAALDLSSPDSKFVNLYIKKEGIVKGQTFKRACIVSFPFYQCKETADPIIFGKKIERQKDKKSIIAFIEHLLPKSDTPGEYDVGSADLNTPSLCCLLEAVGNIFVQLNNFVLLYKDLLPLAGEQFADVDQFVTDLYWYDGLDHITKYRSLVPALDGNQGVASKVEDVSTNNTAAKYTLKDRDNAIPAATTVTQHAAAPVQSQQQSTAPVAPDTGIPKVSFNDYMRQKSGNVAPPPAPYGHPHYNQPPVAYQHPAQGYPQPGYPQGYPQGYPPPMHPQQVYRPGVQQGYPQPMQQGYPPPGYPQYNAGGTGLSPGRAAAIASAYQPQPMYPQGYGPAPIQQPGIYYR